METIKGLGHSFIFIKVAQLSSYSKAARELNVSKAYISKSIQQLEEEVGQKLLNRTTRIVKLTHEGQKFYEVCSKSINAIEQAKDSLRASTLMPQGMLRITAAGAFAEEYITPVAARMLELYPNLKVEISLSEKVVNLVEENFDLGIRVGQLYDSSLIAKRIATRREYICATKKYFAEHGTPKSASELLDHNCLCGNNANWVFKDGPGQMSVRVKGNFKSNNARVLLKCALNGNGIVRLPETYVKKYIDQGELISVLESELNLEVPIWAIYPASKNRSINISFFLMQLKTHFESI